MDEKARQTIVFGVLLLAGWYRANALGVLHRGWANCKTLSQNFTDKNVGVSTDTGTSNNFSALDYAVLPLVIRKASGKQLRFLLANRSHPSLRAKKYNEALDFSQGRVTRDWRFYFNRGR